MSRTNLTPAEATALLVDCHECDTDARTWCQTNTGNPAKDLHHNRARQVQEIVNLWWDEIDAQCEADSGLASR